MFSGCASPVYVARSSQELLDNYLEQSVAVHTAAVQSKQSLGVQTSHEGLLADVRLLHVALLFERHQRNLYVRRNSQLLSQIAHLTSIREQNEAIVSGFIKQSSLLLQACSVFDVFFILAQVGGFPYVIAQHSVIRLFSL